MRYYEKDIEGPKFAMKSERAEEVMPEPASKYEQELS